MKGYRRSVGRTPSISYTVTELPVQNSTGTYMYLIECSSNTDTILCKSVDDAYHKVMELLQPSFSGELFNNNF